MHTTTNPRIFGVRAESVHEILTNAHGFRSITSVVANLDTTEVTLQDRAEAFSLSRLFINSFEGDPEAGDFNVQMQQIDDHTWVVIN